MKLSLRLALVLLLYGNSLFPTMWYQAFTALAFLKCLGLLAYLIMFIMS